MRVATYNVHDCVGRDGRFDPLRITTVINELDADVIALQEVTLDHGGDLLRQFEAATGMVAVDGTLFARGVGHYGNLLLTRHRVVGNRSHDIAFGSREPRGVVDAVLHDGSDHYRVLATHLGLSLGERRDQLARLAALVNRNGAPTILLGDFNVWWSRRPLALLARRGFEHCAVRSFPNWRWPLAALDRIFVSPPLKQRHCRRHTSRLARIASDHYPVVTEVTRQKIE
ncbi:endonuclease/exonuclease/phosphatase family protein [Thiosocius teredinicola]|uniref:endonuclease/exonuclease/phosphatase family protein n=1 Tax=Thiosocius teredinicola TaxID=1973002 RepID=UPI000990D5EB